MSSQGSKKRDAGRVDQGGLCDDGKHDVMQGHKPKNEDCF